MLSNILVAYPYMTPKMIDVLNANKDRTRFLLDSGAFTAWKAGKPINLDDYCKFIERLPFEPWRYFMLDVIGNPHATMKNYETMLARGFKPVPIFTRGEDPSVLDDYYKTSDLVAIGGLVGTQGNKGFVKGIMEKVAGRKVHWLGFTNLNFVRYFKPYSCDASSWNNGAQFGYVQFIDKQRMETLKYSRKQYTSFSLAHSEALEATFTQGGRVIDHANWKGEKGVAMLTGAKAWTELAYLYEKHLGVIILTAVTVPTQVQILLDEYSRFQEAK